MPALGEHRHDVGDDAERRDGEDVERGLPEDPGDAVVEPAGAAEELVAVARGRRRRAAGRPASTGRVSSQTVPPTSIDHENSGVRRRRHARRPQGQDGGDDGDRGDERAPTSTATSAATKQVDASTVGAERPAVDAVGRPGRGRRPRARSSRRRRWPGGRPRSRRPPAAAPPRWPGRAAAAATRGRGRPIECSVNICTSRLGAEDLGGVEPGRSKPTRAPTTPDASRNSSDVPTNSLPTVRGSPEPTTAASPTGGADGDGAAAASTAAARGASVTVMNAPWAGDWLCSGI